MANGFLLVALIYLSQQTRHAVAPPPPSTVEAKHRHQSLETLEAIVSDTKPTEDKSETSNENDSTEKKEKEPAKLVEEEGEENLEGIQRIARQPALDLGLFEPVKRQVRAPQMIDFISAGGQSWSPATPVKQRRAFPEDERDFMPPRQEHSKRQTVQPIAFPFRLDSTGLPAAFFQQAGPSSLFPQMMHGMTGFQHQPFMMTNPQLFGMPQNFQLGGPLPQGFSGVSSTSSSTPNQFTASTGFGSMPNQFTGTGFGIAPSHISATTGFSTTPNQFTGASFGMMPTQFTGAGWGMAPNQVTGAGFGAVPNQFTGSSFSGMPNQFSTATFGQSGTAGNNQGSNEIQSNQQLGNQPQFKQGSNTFTPQPLNNQIPSFQQTNQGQGFHTITSQTPTFQQGQFGSQNTPTTQPSQGTTFQATSVPSFLQQQNATSPLPSQTKQRHTLPQPTILRRPIFLAGQRSRPDSEREETNAIDDEVTVEVDYEAEGAERKN